LRIALKIGINRLTYIKRDGFHVVQDISIRYGVKWVRQGLHLLTTRKKRARAMIGTGAVGFNHEGAPKTREGEAAAAGAVSLTLSPWLF
jgi:hypothetical protein